MTAVQQLSALPLVHAFGWTLIHFCWQGGLVAIILACGLGLIPLRFSRLRYAIACAAMAIMLALPLFTFCILAANTQEFAISAAASGSSHAISGSFDQPAEPWITQCERILNQWLPAVIGFWLAGVLVLVCRLNLGLLATKKIKSLAVETAPAEIEHVMRALLTRLGIQRAVGLLHSTRVQAPSVIGWLRPAILLPVGCMAGLSTLQVEAILAHELAHIRRHDYLVSLFQSLVETLLFYHPAVWWVSNQIRREREHCCDDLAVTVCGDRLAYAKALALLEQRRGPIPAGAFGATGGVLKMRIARLLGLKQQPDFPRTPAVILLVLVLTTAGLAAWGSARAQSTDLQRSSTPSQSPSSGSSADSHRSASHRGTPVRVRSLTIESADLPADDRLQIVHAYRGGTYPLQELLQLIRQDLRSQGYAFATVQILEPSAAPSGPPPQPVDVSARVSAGAKYRFGGISIEGAHAFSQKTIQQQFPIQPGDLFNATAIGKGLDGLKKLYASKGYVNFGAIVNAKRNDVNHTITLVLDFREGKTQ